MYVELLMFVLTPADGLCCVWLIYPIWCWLRCPEIEISSVDWAQPSRLLPEDGDRIQSPKLFNWTMDNVQKVNYYVNSIMFTYPIYSITKFYSPSPPETCHVLLPNVRFCFLCQYCIHHWWSREFWFFSWAYTVVHTHCTYFARKLYFREYVHR
jgi:hypothetical protein